MDQVGSSWKREGVGWTGADGNGEVETEGGDTDCLSFFLQLFFHSLPNVMISLGALNLGLHFGSF